MMDYDPYRGFTRVVVCCGFLPYILHSIYTMLTLLISLTMKKHINDLRSNYYPLRTHVSSSVYFLLMT